MSKDTPAYVSTSLLAQCPEVLRKKERRVVSVVPEPSEERNEAGLITLSPSDWIELCGLRVNIVARVPPNPNDANLLEKGLNH